MCDSSHLGQSSSSIPILNISVLVENAILNCTWMTRLMGLRHIQRSWGTFESLLQQRLQPPHRFLGSAPAKQHLHESWGWRLGCGLLATLSLRCPPWACPPACPLAHPEQPVHPHTLLPEMPLNQLSSACARAAWRSLVPAHLA